MSVPFTGIIPPVLTPFTADEEIDLPKFRKDVAFMQSVGVHGLGVAGSTGEGAVLSPDEVGELVRVTRKETGGKLPVIAGVIADSVREALVIGREAKEAGADGFLITPVYYNGATEEGNYSYYEVLTEELGLPTIVYNVVATNQISASLMARIIKLPNVIGIKQVAADTIGDMVRACGKHGGVYSACDNMLYPTYVAGALGTIAAIATVAPAPCVEQWEAGQKADHKTAGRIHDLLGPIVASYLQRPFPGKVKYACELQGRPMGAARRPTTGPSEVEAEAIRSSLKAAGLL